MIQTVLLGDIINLKRGYDLPASRRIYGKYPIISSSGITDYHAEMKVKGPGVVTGRYGTLGCSYFVEGDFWPLNTTLYVQDFKGNNEKYISYILGSMKLGGENIAGAVPGVNRNFLHKIKVPYLYRANQDKVVEIIDSIDEKIELNRKMNETLEQMGQALFRHYFITNSASEHLSLGDVAEVIDCLHSKKPEKLEVETGNVLLQLNNIKDDGTLDLTEKYHISEEDYLKWVSRIEASENDFVITNVGRSGAVAKIPSGVKAALGRNMTAIRLKSKTSFPGFMSFLLNSPYMKKQIEARLDHGTILSALNVKNIPKLLLPTADTNMIFTREDEFLTLRHKIEANVNETQNLTTLRDTLLPRLINGKVKI